MARIRTVKPEFWTDEKVVEMSPLARLLFIGLWNFADDEGRMTYSPKRIGMQILPADSCDISALLGEIRRNSLIVIYEVDGIEYLQIVGFAKHQKVDKRTASKLPAPPESPRIVPTEGIKEGKGREGIKELKPAASQPDSDPWIIGKQFLVKRGVSEATVGAFLGKLVKDHGKQPVIDALQAAIVNEPADVKSYLVGALRGKSAGRFDPVAYNARTA